MPDNNLDALNDAIARSSSAVVSLPSAGVLRHCKSRFLMQVDNGFWMEAATETLLIDELIRKQQPIAVSFKLGDKKVCFAVPIKERKADLALNETTTVQAILLPFPKDVKATQRRNNYRVKIPGDGELRVRIWRIAEKAYLGDRPMAAQEITTILRDISSGGIGTTFVGKDGQLPRISPADRLRIEIKYKENEPLLLEGRMRPPTVPPKDGKIITGVRFENLDAGIEGRRTQVGINKIVGDLQREEVRRTRLGLTG